MKNKGYLVVHDATNIETNKLDKLSSWGYKLINQFSLPDDAWWTEFYKPFEIKINQLYKKYNENPEALENLRKYRNEIDMVKKNPKEHSSAFYVMQKRAHAEMRQRRRMSEQATKSYESNSFSSAYL